MKKVMKLTALLLVMASVLTACGSPNSEQLRNTEEDKETHVAVVLGTHANAPVVNLALIEDEVYKACYSGGAVTLIVADGEPWSTYIDIPVPWKGLSSTRLANNANEQTSQVLDAASKLLAKAPETDTLAAVQLAGRTLSSAESQSGKEVECQLIVLDSMLPTTGTMNLTGSLLDTMDMDSVMTQLEDSMEMADFSGTDVILYTLGDVAEPQPELSPKERSILKELWQGYFEGCGADSVSIRDNLPSSTSYDVDKLPPVTPVAVVHEGLELGEKELSMGKEDIYSFDETMIAFQPGSAEMCDPSKVQELLTPVAEYLKSHTDTSLLVVGTTAMWGGADYCEPLSQKRAAAVCQELVTMGADEAQLSPLGVGYDNPFYINDQGADGKLDESIAPQNRTVRLMRADSTMAQNLVKK